MAPAPDILFNQELRDSLIRLMLAMNRAVSAADSVAVATKTLGASSTLAALSGHFEVIAAAGGK